MSSGLMDTAPGGESTQYESIHTVTKPTKKSGGQFGEPETEVDVSSEQAAKDHAAAGAATAEKIRYGQAISEHGMGGQTTTSSGSANQDSAYGGAASSADDGAQDAGSRARKEAGYGGAKDMDTEIGG
ncbi:hypothetical protein AAFC00_002133 [Neodothiora populina]|uniref:Uncharacterized protein n=1 Tax=Neodothiora populina TaxID=2781224 RepID=A0ABR3PHK6_9PEZI